MHTRQITRPGIICAKCHILRLLPEGIHFGQRFQLGPCGGLHCGLSLAGRYFGFYVWRS
jgi:hypothetical protein